MKTATTKRKPRQKSNVVPISADDAPSPASPDTSLTECFRAAVEQIREGVGDVSRALSGCGPIDEPGAYGFVQILAGIRELELIDRDLARCEEAFNEKGQALRAQGAAGGAS